MSSQFRAFKNSASVTFDKSAKGAANERESIGMINRKTGMERTKQRELPLEDWHGSSLVIFSFLSKYLGTHVFEAPLRESPSSLVPEILNAQQRNGTGFNCNATTSCFPRSVASAGKRVGWRSSLARACGRCVIGYVEIAVCPVCLREGFPG